MLTLTTTMSAKTLRPRLEVLQRFSNRYFRTSPPAVKWHTFKDNSYYGMAKYEINSIYLNRNIPIEHQGCMAGRLIPLVPRRKFVLIDGEQYFLVLLHEIGHYKISKRFGIKVPKWFKPLKQKIQQEYPDDIEKQHYSVEYYIAQKPGQPASQWLGIVENFKCYLITGDSVQHHGAVELWARNEFKKRRRVIRSLISACA